MVVELTIKNDPNPQLFFHIDEDKLEVLHELEHNIINTTYKDRFNTLLALFSLKKDWVSEEKDNYKYHIYFKNNDIEENYYLNKQTPLTFPLFLDYLGKLIGDSYE